MIAAPYDFTPLLPAGMPAAAAKWTGLAKYSFVGGNNDLEQVPLDGLVDAVNAVLKREGRTLATYGLESGPQGYRPLRQFLSAKLKHDSGERGCRGVTKGIRRADANRQCRDESPRVSGHRP
jgi:2-aminoadipate transaminase